MAANDRTTENLRGPVRRVERIFSYGGGSFTEYDESGRLSASGMRNPDGAIFRTSYFYHDSGRTTHLVNEHPGQRWTSARYIYDEAGRLVRIAQLQPDGSEAEPAHVRETADGGRVEIVTITMELPDPVEGVQVGFEITSVVPGARTRTTEYDPQNRKLAVMFHDSEHNLLSSMRYVYDDAGRLVEEIHTWGRYNLLDYIMKLGEDIPEAARGVLAGVLGDGAKGFHTTYTYDEQGRQIEHRMDQGPFGVTVTRTEYNERGDISRTIHESKHQELRVGSEGVQPEEKPPAVSVNEYEYVYDHHGNWTTRTVRTPAIDPEAAPHITLETRRIEYFE